MSNSKWLRRALLGGVALSVMATGAQADELTALKAQLEALQGRVNSLEAAPAPAALPEGYNYLTFAKGQGSNNWGVQPARDVRIPDERGFTVGITPTADLPAPVAEVTVYGFIAAYLAFDFDDHTGKGFYVPYLGTANGTGDDHFSVEHNKTRFGIRSKVDTAVGQIRTRVEVQAAGNGSVDVRLRHGYGEWDMTENWTLLTGQTWRTANLLQLGISTVDESAYAGPLVSRTAQARLTYNGGPITWAFAIERASFNTTTNMPNLATYFQYDVPGGHIIYLSGVVSDWVPGDDTGWALGAGANVNLGDVATLTVGGHYGEGEVGNYLEQGGFTGSTATNLAGGAAEGWGVFAGLSIPLTDSTTANIGYGHNEWEDVMPLATADRTQTINANIMWQPVKQMRIGAEIMWGQARNEGTGNTDDNIRALLGTWWFF